MDQRPGGLFISLLCRPAAAAAAKKRPAKRANKKRLEKQRARRTSQQLEQQAVAAAASAAAPTAITPSCELQQPNQAARAAPATAAATAAPLPTAATTAPQPASTVEPPARSKVILSLKNVALRKTRSPSKKRKVETPSDSDPATPEGGSFPLLSQLDGADLSPTPPTPEPALPDPKKSLLDGEVWSLVRPSRRNPW